MIQVIGRNMSKTFAKYRDKIQRIPAFVFASVSWAEDSFPYIPHKKVAQEKIWSSIDIVPRKKTQLGLWVNTYLQSKYCPATALILPSCLHTF